MKSIKPKSEKVLHKIDDRGELKRKLDKLEADHIKSHGGSIGKFSFNSFVIGLIFGLIAGIFFTLLFLG